MPAQSLVPGYRQVEAFGPDEEYEDEEEVSYVTFDLGTVEPTLLSNSSTYRLIGLDTPTPYLQLAGSIFKGRHDSLLGTELLFTEEKTDKSSTKRSLVHAGSTEQRVCFKEVQLKEKARRPPEAESEAPHAPGSGSVVAQPDLYLEMLSGQSSASPVRKRKRGSKKGKERAIEPYAS
ncbi:hypothetical protein F5J12DRAFT_825363 [Pisolithus orientalis]|uniref:uncharacterized protein n=1 Tax=Pisolithus orientalis TaxID=936130 RepID=UPI002224E36A|nr:uncharacterized protein F5J12DRAFT_825363 [Pisolithus orientalis]KAI6008751.1 hypothetical protein F5J12DRAFT_825363 [Pisolithus orientalis]